MSLTSIYRSRGILSLCVVMSMALALQGAPTSTSPSLQRSEKNSAPIYPKSRKVEFPILPPDENMDTIKLESEKTQEDDLISGDGHISGSGDNLFDYSDYPIPIKKPTMFEDIKRGNKEEA